MCVIIYREPKTEIPFDKLKSACLVNADGMGLVVVDRGQLTVRKFFEEKGNNPEVLNKFFEDTKDCHVYAHLRFRTKGPKNKENVHPFGVLTKKHHGMDLQFMHNGTLSEFGNDTDCDSKVFAKNFLRPLSERFLATIDKEKLLHDELYKSILEKYSGKSSVFLVLDNYGNHQIINFDNGKDFGGWWASNEYSFNKYHRDPYPSSGSRWDNRNATHREWPSESPKKVVSLASVPVATNEVPFNTESANDKEVTIMTENFIIPKRERFIDAANLTKLSDVCALSNMEIADLVDEHPEEAVLLILDLLEELFNRDKEYDDEVAGEAAVS